MEKNLSIALIATMLLCGCAQKQQQLDDVTLLEETLPPVIPLQLEKIDIPEEYTMGSCCYVYQDSVLLVLKEGNPAPLTHMLTLFNINTGAKIGEYFTRGQGPRELLFPVGGMSYNWLDLRCLAMNRFVSFNIDSALLLGDKYNPKMVTSNWHWELDYRRFDDTSFLVTCMAYFDGCEDYNSDASFLEFYKLSYTGNIYPTPSEWDTGNKKKFPGNVTGCDLLVNLEKQKVACCYHYRPYIKLFDLDMTPIRQINGPEPDDGRYTAGRMGLFFDERKGYNHYYIGSFCDNDNIFSVNRRTHGLRFDVKGDSFNVTERKTTEIFQFDWDGNVMARYSAKGYNISHVTYSGKTNTIYLWMYDEDDERCLYKAKLN